MSVSGDRAPKAPTGSSEAKLAPHTEIAQPLRKRDLILRLWPAEQGRHLVTSQPQLEPAAMKHLNSHRW